jgi:hypothetical protein
MRKIGIERDFVVAHLVTHQKMTTCLNWRKAHQAWEMGRIRLSGGGSVFSKTSAALFRRPS